MKIKTPRQPHGNTGSVKQRVYCPAHAQDRRDTWPGDSFTTDPQHLWDFLEQIGVMTPQLGMREREREQDHMPTLLISSDEQKKTKRDNNTTSSTQRKKKLFPTYA